MASLFARTVRSIRKKADLSQEKLAELAGVSTGTISRIERDGPVDDKSRWLVVDALEKYGGDVTKLKSLLEAPTQPTIDPSPPPDILVDEPPEPNPNHENPPPKPRIDDNGKVLRRWMFIGFAALLIVLLAIGGTVYWALIGKNIYNTISGQVTCPNNQRVVGIYIVAVNGGSYRVNYRQYLDSAESVAKFTYVLPDGGAYNLHVGCGGDAGNWANAYNTENCSGPIDDRDFHALIAYDQLPKDRSKPCLVWAKQ